jgi:TldD protein
MMTRQFGVICAPLASFEGSTLIRSDRAKVSEAGPSGLCWLRGDAPRTPRRTGRRARDVWWGGERGCAIGFCDVDDGNAPIDPEFAGLELKALADAALDQARRLGAQHADFRVERIRGQRIRLSDARLQSLSDADDSGLAVRVVVDGTWGFASAVDLTPEAAAAAAASAVEVARVAAAMNTERIELAPEPAYGDVTWVSAYEVDPFTVAPKEKVDLLAAWSATLLAHDAVSHADASLLQVKECKFYTDGATTATQQRVRLHPELTAIAVTESGFDDMRTIAPPAGRGWEYLTGTGCDLAGEITRLPELLAAKLAAPSVEPGRYDLVIDPSNLWLTIHESIGHATELDRALGYEAAYAGTSFATLDKLGSLQYGSPVMNVTGDRTAVHGLATIGYDDEGVAGQSWDLISGGVLVGYQLDRRMAQLKGFGRSNGCAFADSPGHMPLQRMANVSLRPVEGGEDTAGLISDVQNGIYIVGDKSWSIDMQRYNFQFTGQRFFRIRNGRLDGQLKDVAYQATTTEFWNSMEAVGGPQTYVLGGAFNCGKGQPGQVAPVSHGAPAALFRGVRVLNTAEEGSA